MKLSRSPLAAVCAALLPFVFAPALSAQIRVPDDYATIQAAVNASRSGGHIRIRAGRYVEQVVIRSKNLTLRGDAGATLVTPAAMVQTLLPFTQRHPLLTVRDAVVHVHGLSFDGQRSGLTHRELSGIYLLDASGHIQRCSFTGFRRATSNPGFFPTAIHVANPEEAGGRAVRHVRIARNTIDDTEIPILLKGDLESNPMFDPSAVRLRATVVNNDLTGILWAEPQWGMVAQWGAKCTIFGNKVSGFIGGTPTQLSTGIVLGDASSPAPFVFPRSVVAGNRVTNCAAGILTFFGKRTLIVGNKVVAGPTDLFGIGLTGNDCRVIANHVDMSASGFSGSSGIVMVGLESGGPTFAFGKAIDTLVTVNTVVGGVIPIWEQTGTSGTRLIRNRLLP